MKALLVDDEEGNRALLANMIQKHCSQITLLGSSSSADEAFHQINTLKPDLVFLDIKMPEKNGFDLLRMYNQIDFAVIFVTGFDEYAITAFEFNAVDYLLKPLDHGKLVSAVNKATSQLNAKTNILHFVHSLEEKTDIIHRVTLHGKDKVSIIEIKDIIYIEANRGYSEIHTSHNQKFMSAKTLAEYEELLKPIPDFIRVNKSHIINVQFLDSYSKGSDCFLYLKGCKKEIEVSRRKKTEVITHLKGK